MTADFSFPFTDFCFFSPALLYILTASVLVVFLVSFFASSSPTIYSRPGRIFFGRDFFDGVEMSTTTALLFLCVILGWNGLAAMDKVEWLPADVGIGWKG